jgi:GH18 family chitinase
MYYNIMSQLSSMTSMRHEPSKTQYAYFSSAAGGGLVSYDDEQAICDKTQYVMDNDLNGFIIWELSGDLMSRHRCSIWSIISWPSRRCHAVLLPLLPVQPTQRQQ